MTFPVDMKALRRSLRQLSRGDLLLVAERAANTVPNGALASLLADRIELQARDGSEDVSVLDEVLAFHAQSMAGKFYESFDVNSHNCNQQSRGTDAFVAELDRLVERCVRESETDSGRVPCQAFEVLFDLLRHIDGCHDDVLFFADEGGAWSVGMPWLKALPAYFRCLAAAQPASEFAERAAQVIEDFVGHDRRRYLTLACEVAAPEQRAALSERAPSTD